jgi:general secretion pathway protein F
MPVYEYKALDKKGRKISGLIDADSPRSARLRLRAEGFFPMEIHSGAEMETKVPALPRGLSWGAPFRRISGQQRAALTRQLATMLKAGIPLVSALDTFIQQTTHKALRRALVDVREQILEGRTLAEALSRHPWLFSDLYVNMIRAGESSGALETVLLRLADLLERNVRLKNKVQSALFYPILMMGVGTVILVFLLTYVVPIVSRLFLEAKQKLPLPTQILIATSDFVIHWWWLLLMVGIVMVVLLNRSLATQTGRLLWDKIKLRLPLIGSLYQKLIIARFGRTLGTLLEGGVPLTTALSIVQHVINNQYLAGFIEGAITEINEGAELSVPLEKSGAFPSMVIQMIAAGERSGSLEEMLLNISEAYENEVENSLAALISLLEPTMIMIMGVCVGFIVLSILLPILDYSRVFG